MNRIIYIFLLIALASPAIAHPKEWKSWKDEDQPAEYYSKELKARVVDADTGDPIKKAKVVAQWILESPFGGWNGGLLEIVETTTDKDGWFYIPARGPMKRLKFTMLKQKDPNLIISKDGYKTKSLINANKEYLIKNGITFKKLEEDPQRKPLRIIVKTFKFAEVDSDILTEGISQDYSDKIIPKGSIRDSIWDGRTIKLKTLEGK